MVTVSLDKQGIGGYILLEPDVSLGWRKNIHIFLVFSFFMLMVAVFFTLSGKWLVLPFSGLELIVFFFALYVFFRRVDYCEIIRFSLDSVIIEQGKNAAESSQDYKRLWSKFYIDRADKLSMPKIFIRCHQQQTEIGSFLSYKDKIKVIDLLKNTTRSFNHHYCEK